MILLYCLLILLGFTPLIIVVIKISNVQKLKRHGVKVEGIVREVTGSVSSGLSTVIIEYPVVGTPHIVSKKLTVGGMPYSVGQRLILYYDPVQPHEMRFDSGKGFILLIVFTLLLAALMIFLCFWISDNVANTSFTTMR